MIIFSIIHFRKLGILKYLIILVFFGGTMGWAQEIPLFGSVVNLAKNDTLNVRSSPSYHSKKIGALPLNAYVGVDACKKIGKSLWCKVHHIAQRDYEEFGYGATPGWINAKYLDPSNSGYVIINGKPDCDYALRCKKGKCEVVESYETNEKNEITSIKTKWIDRKRLRGSSNFGAMTEDPDASGYCTNGNYIQDYLREKRLNVLMGKDNDIVRHRAIAFVEVLSSNPLWSENILSYIHPKKGVIMTWNVRFGGEKDMQFGYSAIKNMEKNREQKIDWGQTFGKGDDVLMSLYDYIKMLTRPVMAISKVQKLKDLKGFKCAPKSECKGYEVFWIDKDSDMKEYNWQGLVVILEKSQNTWYVVGILRDRWTI
jgi:hypothetical protein